MRLLTALDKDLTGKKIPHAKRASLRALAKYYDEFHDVFKPREMLSFFTTFFDCLEKSGFNVSRETEQENKKPRAAKATATEVPSTVIDFVERAKQRKAF